MINLYNIDCMKALKEMSDNEFNLAIVDPPYGINIAKTGKVGISNKHAKASEFKKKDWDNAIPNKEYFTELIRVSKNQIIWGGNYFIEYLKNTSCFIVWDKNNKESFFADGELAWTSFNTAVRIHKYTWFGFIQQDMKNKEKKIHPTQKPVKLYEWLLMNHAKEGDKILDTHLGSGSIAIACSNLGFDLEGYELDKDYFDAAKKRLEQHQAQKRLF